MDIVIIYDLLDPEKAIGTVENLLQNGVGKGTFGKYLYCLKNGKQVLLGHSNPYPVGPGGYFYSMCIYYGRYPLQTKCRHLGRFESIFRARMEYRNRKTSRNQSLVSPNRP